MRPKRDVFEVADRRRDHVENAFRVAGHRRILSYHCEDGLSPELIATRVQACTRLNHYPTS